jgi:hypothetical protein
MRRVRPAAGIAGTALLLLTGGTLQAEAATDYTHASTLKRACMIHANYPKAGVADWGWTKEVSSPKGTRYHLGVRYTYQGYALVLDYARKAEPSWGFVAAGCLTDPQARSHSGATLPDLRAPGGHGAVKDVPISAPHGSRTAVATIHVGEVGTLRSAPRSFVIGNVRAGDPFQITTAHCGRHGTESWILGYAPNSGRWGYVEAMHLPACR